MLNWITYKKSYKIVHHTIFFQKMYKCVIFSCCTDSLLWKWNSSSTVHFSLQWFLSFYICWHFPLKSPKNISSRATCLCLEKWARKRGLNGKFNISLLSGNSLTVYNLRLELQMTCLWNEISTHQITENDKLMTSQF